MILKNHNLTAQVEVHDWPLIADLLVNKWGCDAEAVEASKNGTLNVLNAGAILSDLRAWGVSWKLC